MAECPDLPNENRVLINVSSNESPDSATINRGNNRLLENDLKLHEWVCQIFNTEIGDGLSGKIGDFLEVDEDYFINLFNELAVSSLVSGLYLDNLTDVTITNPLSGQSLIFDGTEWINGSPDLLALSGAFLQEIEHVSSLSTTNSATLCPDLPPTTLSASFLYEYPISGLSSVSGTINGDEILGYTITAANWGRLDTDRTGIGGATWRTEVQYPDGNYYTICAHHSENIDDDGGMTTTVFVPFDSDIQDTIRVRAVLFNNDPTRTDSNGDPVNRFCINTIAQKTDNIGLTPDLDITYVRGTVSATDPGVLSTGKIKSTTTTDPYSIWVSTPNAVTYTDWSTIFPMAIPPRTSKTEIEFENYLALSGITATLDPGAEEGSIGLAKGSIFVDWLSKKVTGLVNYYKGPGYTLQGAGVLSGGLNQNLQFISTSGLWTDLEITCGFDTSFRQITSLPCVVDPSTNRIANNVSYTIRHYNVIGVDGLPKIETFVGENTSNSITHDLSKTPDMFQCNIGGFDVLSYFSYSVRPNGTDGGLAYSFSTSRISAGTSSISITGPFPAGTRRWSGLVLPDNT